MAILEKEVWVNITNNYRYYEDLGYKIPKYIDKQGKIRIKRGTQISVKIDHLLKGSALKLTKICDKCGNNTKDISYNLIILQREKLNGKDLCKSCSYKFHGNIKRNTVKYENSAEFFCKENEIDFLINLFSSKNNKKMNEISHGTADTYIWNCRMYGDKHEHSMRMHSKLKSPHGCPYCNGNKVNETNCLTTTHPHISELLWNKEDGLSITHGSAKKFDFKCPYCEFKIKNKRLNNIVNFGLSCPKCGDGVSYPEKYLFHTLTQLGVKFETQKIFDWSENKRYDFYIPSLSAIIEVHGRQHFEGMDGLSRGNTLEQEIENDKYKRRVAIFNGIREYIAIDARLSESEHIKNNIISQLSPIFNLKNINWESCHRYSCSSMVRMVAELYNKGLNSNEIEKSLNLSKQTCNVYLHKATEARLCEYDSLSIKRANALIASMKVMRPVVQLTLDNNFVKEYRSIRNAAEQLSVDHATIGRVLNPKYRNKTGAGYKWMYKEDYDEYIKQSNIR